MYHFLKLFTIECMISKTVYNSSCRRNSISYLSGNFTCISYKNKIFFVIFRVNFLKLFLRMYNFNDNKNYRYNYAPYSYNKLDQPGNYHQWNLNKFNVLAQGLNWIKIIHQLAETLFFRNQVSNMQIEIYLTHSWIVSRFF